MISKVNGSYIEVFPERTGNVTGVLIHSSLDTLSVVQVVFEKESIKETLLRFNTSDDGHYILVITNSIGYTAVDGKLYKDDKEIEIKSFIESSNVELYHFLMKYRSYLCLLKSYQSGRCSNKFNKQNVSVALLLGVAVKAFEIGDYSQVEEAINLLYSCGSPCLSSNCDCYE